jgi:CRP/FNR family transcriptional regulator, cyclic AMP receptor protein
MTPMASPTDVLQQIPMFSMLSKRDIQKLLQDVHDRTFTPGTVLTEQDESGSYLMFTVIVEGAATVSVNGQAVRQLHDGDFFGEMALITRGARSATVTADSDVRCLMISPTVFRPFAMFHPEVLWALLELMVERVRDAEARTA